MACGALGNPDAGIVCGCHARRAVGRRVGAHSWLVLSRFTQVTSDGSQSRLKRAMSAHGALCRAHARLERPWAAQLADSHSFSGLIRPSVACGWN